MKTLSKEEKLSQENASLIELQSKFLQEINQLKETQRKSFQEIKLLKETQRQLHSSNVSLRDNNEELSCRISERDRIEEEIRKLNQKISSKGSKGKLPSPIEEIIQEKKSLEEDNLRLKELVSWYQRQYFGKKSEKTVKPLEDNVVLLPGMEEFLKENKKVDEKKDKKYISGHTRNPSNKGKDAITYPEDLPVERIEIDLPEKDKICPETGKPLIKIGEEATRKLAHIPERFYIKEYVRPIYVFPKDGGIGVRTADLPDFFLPKCRADEGLLAEIIVKKFADHSPCYRISEALKRIDIQISRQLLSQWILRAGLALKPLHELMLKKILETGNIFIDETPVDMLSPGKGKTHQAYMWTVAGGKERDPPVRVYLFKTNRKHDNLLAIIGEDYLGYLHSDKYGAYVKFAGEKDWIWCPCWSHIRRQFLEVESGDLELRDTFLRYIRYLFRFESIAWDRSPEERLKIREEKEKPIIDKLIKLAKEKLIHGKILPKSKLKSALGYFCSLIPYLKNYLLDPWARLDNNVVERAIRPIAIGRKNWLFVGNEEGGIACGTLLSLVQTCRALGINPREYLEDVFRRIMAHSSNRLEELLPQNWKKS